MRCKRLALGVMAIVICGLVWTPLQIAGAVEDKPGGPRIYFNTASAGRLAKAPGITEELAEAMVTFRKKCGFFKSVADILRVPGMTKEIFIRLNPQVSPEGFLYCVPERVHYEEDDEDEEDPIIAPSKPLC